MIFDKKSVRVPGGKSLIVIPLGPRTLIRRTGKTVQLDSGDPAQYGDLAAYGNPAGSNEQVRFYTASETHQGTRDYQQDALYVSGTVHVSSGEPASVFGVLCDGMGGMQSGGEASRLAVEEMRRELENLPDDQNISAFFRDRIRKLDDMLLRKFTDGSAGTTMVSVVAIENKLFWGAIGDSRVYIIRGDEILQVTRDHNYYLELMEEVEKGKITQAEADNNPKKEALISFIGSGNAGLIDANTEPFLLIGGDIVLLCSDGVNKSLTDGEIRRLISNNSYDLREAASTLVRTAIDIDMEPKDNTSAILIQYIGK